ncbi:MULTISPECIES: AraC family transcriptional regulator [unclassified Streptomyces]|uniref:helix-turn-helix domain-containing protein n=1 Tax=unclassified Streptomyces TaxID=2593676 RepID=UPI00324B1AF4
MSGWCRYLTPAGPHRRLGLVCLGTGAQDGPLPQVRGRTLDCHAVVLVTAGRGSCNGEPVEAPALLRLPAGLPHSYGPDGDGWTEHWALFDGSAADGYADLGYLPPGVGALSDLMAALRSFGRLRRCVGGADPDTAAAAAVHDLIVTLGRPAAEDPVLAALAREAGRPVSVAQLARTLGLTGEALRTAVRTAAGCGPKEYVQRVRISRAKELLAESDLTVSAVARRTGFTDSGYFTRLFTRRVGVPPTAFRTQQRRF